MCKSQTLEELDDDEEEEEEEEPGSESECGFKAAASQNVLCHRLFAQEFNMSNSTYAILPTPENQQLPTRGAYATYATLQNTQHQPTQHIMQFPFQLKGIVSKKNDAQLGL